MSRLSLSSLSSLFAAPSPPTFTSLDTIAALAFSRAAIDRDALIDALRPVAAFTAHLRESVRNAEDGVKGALPPEDIAARGAALLAGYVHAAMATSRFIESRGGREKVRYTSAVRKTAVS